MDIDELEPFDVLDESASWRLLRSSTVGRLAVSVAGQPDIFPVNFSVANDRLVFRTAPGSKLAQVVVNEQVAFETDSVGLDEAWSVVIKGTARILQKQSEIDAANGLPLRPLLPTLKYTFVEIMPREITGRRFVPGPEPERY